MKRLLVFVLAVTLLGSCKNNEKGTTKDEASIVEKDTTPIFFEGVLTNYFKDTNNGEWFVYVDVEQGELNFKREDWKFYFRASFEDTNIIDCKGNWQDFDGGRIGGLDTWNKRASGKVLKSTCFGSYNYSDTYENFDCYRLVELNINEWVREEQNVEQDQSSGESSGESSACRCMKALSGVDYGEEYTKIRSKCRTMFICFDNAHTDCMMGTSRVWYECIGVRY